MSLYRGYFVPGGVDPTGLEWIWLGDRWYWDDGQGATTRSSAPPPGVLPPTPPAPPAARPLTNSAIRATYLVPGTQLLGPFEFSDASGAVGRYYKQDVLEALARKAMHGVLPEDGTWKTFNVSDFNVFDFVEVRPVTKPVEAHWWISTPHSIIANGTFEARMKAATPWCIRPSGAEDRIAKIQLRKINLSSLVLNDNIDCLLYTSPSPRDGLLSRMPSSA